MTKTKKPEGTPQRPVPDDFLTFAPGVQQYILMKHYKASYRTVAHWQKITGVPKCPPPPPPPARRRPIPDGFAEKVRSSYFNDLVKYYKASGDTVRRWLAEVGMEPGRKPGNRGLDRAGRPYVAKVCGFVTKSIYDEAADVLRRERWIVYRCTHKGICMKSGNHWRVGNLVVTPEELLERAERVRRKSA